MHMQPSATQVIFVMVLKILTLKSPNRSKFCISVHSHIYTVAKFWSAVHIVLHMSYAGHVAVCKFTLYVHMVATHL